MRTLPLRSHLRACPGQMVTERNLALHPMSKSVLWRSLPLLAAISCMVCGFASADQEGRRARGKDAEDAAEKAQQSIGGRVLNIQDQNQSDKGGYKVRILTPDGKVRSIEVEPKKDK